MTAPAEPTTVRQRLAAIFGLPEDVLAPYEALGTTYENERADLDEATLAMLDRMERVMEEVREMGFVKHGTGDGRVTETEGSLAKTASGAEFTEADAEALRRENEQADQKEGN